MRAVGVQEKGLGKLELGNQVEQKGADFEGAAKSLHFGGE